MNCKNVSTIPINLHRLIRPACHLVPGWLDMFKFLHCFGEPFEAEFSCLKQSSKTILSIVYTFLLLSQIYNHTVQG